MPIWPEHVKGVMCVISFKTVGCRLNQAETEAMKNACAAAGYEVAPFGGRCDVCVIHGCAVTAKAERDSFRLARAAAKTAGNPLVVLTGCVVVAGPAPVRAGRGTDVVLPMDKKMSLPEVLSGLGFKAGRGGASEPPRERTRALVAAQRGCDFNCTYCVVPSRRGGPVSVPLGEIIADVESLIKRGYREITLTGTNIGTYNYRGAKLTDVLKAVEAVPGLARFRISSIEPTTAEREVVEFMAGSRKLCRSLHLPLQSGDDRILRAMGRRYATADYLDFMAYAGERVGGTMGWGADVIAGFPGEDEESFARTMDFVARLPLCNLHVFEFSPRAGTPAATMDGQASHELRRSRTARLIALGERKKREAALRMKGRSVEVLIERVDEAGAGHGWTGEYIRAKVADAPGVNEVVAVTVLGSDEETVLCAPAGKKDLGGD